MRELLKKFLNIVFLLTLFYSCSVATPIILEHRWKITFIQDKNLDITYESLDLFVNCYDDDGENDIDTIFFISDDSGLYWELNSDTWSEKYINDVRWLGSSNLLMADRSPIPRGKYRIHVRDKAGENVEEKLYITKRRIDTDELEFPILVIERGQFSISNYETGVIDIVLKDEVLISKIIGRDPLSFKDIFGDERNNYTESIEFYINVESGDLSLKSGPWHDN